MRIPIDCDAKNGEYQEKKHRMIARVAAPLFIEKGFHKTSMRDISKATGMALGNLYHYIKSKDDVLFLVYQELYTIWESGLDQLLVENKDDPLKKLKQVILHMMRTGREHKDLTQMTFRETKFLEKKALKKILEIESQFIETIVSIVEEGIAKDVFYDVNPTIIGSLIAHNTFFYPLRSWYFKGQFSYEEIEKQVIDYTLRAIVKHPEKGE